MTAWGRGARRGWRGKGRPASMGDPYEGSKMISVIFGCAYALAAGCISLTRGGFAREWKCLTKSYRMIQE